MWVHTPVGTEKFGEPLELLKPIFRKLECKHCGGSIMSGYFFLFSFWWDQGWGDCEELKCHTGFCKQSILKFSKVFSYCLL